MATTLPRRIAPMLLGSCLALGMGTAAKAEELRIGFLAPITGIFAQIGQDMANGFQMYLDEHPDGFGGAEVTFIVEDTVGKPDTAVTDRKSTRLNSSH